MDSDYRVLSIQSHVVSGYCGNKSAVFPLQSLGFEVDFINSVQFSNHTGYGKWTGQVLNESDLLELFAGLKQNNLHRKYTHILTGYARSASFLEAMFRVINEIKTISPNVIYLCDPVMGDQGKMYVPQELLPIYKEKIVPLADVICPNQFEAELLSDVKITDLDTAVEAIDKLHAKGIKTVVISSTEIGFGEQNQLISIASSNINNGQKREMFTISIPRLNANFIGTGDLFASLFLAWFSKTNYDLKRTLENVIATLQSIIKRTYNYAIEQGKDGLSKTANIELKIIQGRDDIIKPNVSIKAQPIVRP